MRKKLTIGLLMLVIGMLLQEVSYITDIWIIRVIGGILLPIGMVKSINALISLKQNN